MATYNLNVRASWTPSADALGSITTKSSPLTVSEHDETHKYLYTKCAIQYLNDVSLSSPASKDFLIYNGTSWRNFPITGDVTINADGTATVSKVNNKTMSFSNGFATVGGHSITLTTIGTTSVTLPTSGTLLNDTLYSGYMYMGSSSNVATGYQIDTSGDITASIVSSKIRFTISNYVITDTNVSTTANILSSKIYASPSSIIISNSSGNLTAASTSIYPSLTELSYLKGVTSSIQSQINNITSGSVVFPTLSVDNININGNTISSTNTAGDILLTPHITGNVVISNGYCYNDFKVAGNKLLLDADNDTYIMASTDDRIEFHILGNNNFHIEDGVITLNKNIRLSIGSYQFNIRGDGATGQIVIGDGTDEIAFFGATPSAVSTGWSVTNHSSTVKTIDCNESVVQNVAAALGELIAELISKGLIQA